MRADPRTTLHALNLTYNVHFQHRSRPSHPPSSPYHVPNLTTRRPESRRSYLESSKRPISNIADLKVCIYG
ncbi:hypothetical protein SCLCIDRAFT_1216705 [Scleroderma citrinum Foug A]|uniref:Uncharacterized protein n=1 Tax=Scleroderma citrinum Foug A TaxID=1036808 RepID=A0A0C3A754_9AGAM|nr:hypothetical protein SCLCIDRAFT_1216705 [Scleroderma citrinum Foug A]